MSVNTASDTWRWAYVSASLAWAVVSFTLVSSALPTWFKVTFGCGSALFSLAIPYIVPRPYVELEVFVRICAGYLAMKILDLCVARAYRPPKLLSMDGRMPTTPAERLHYTWRLGKETRYESFDISVVRSSSAPPPAQQSLNLTYHLATFSLVALLNHFLPVPEVKILVVLLSITTVFSLGHLVLRPSSRVPLFDTPFLAPTLGSFWRWRWHAIILSPLTSLAFDPCSRVSGRIAGVLAAFGLSGLWHAWAVVPMGGYKVAGRVLIVFVMQGVGVLLEAAVWEKRKTMLRRVGVWVWSLGWAGWALRGWNLRGEYGL